MRRLYLLKKTQSGKTSNLVYHLYNYLNNTNNLDVSFDDIELQETITEPRRDDFTKASKGT